MTTQATMMQTANDSAALRRVLLIDATASGAMGAALLLAAGSVEHLLGLPASLLRWAGVILVPFAALLAWAATRERAPRGVVHAIVGGNVLWALGSVLLLVTGALRPTLLGELFVLLQAAIVAGLAYLEHVASRRAG